MSISFSSSLMLSPLPFAMKPSLVIRARVRKWRRFELVTTANHEADVIRSDNSRWMTVERKSLASTRNRFFLKVWNYDLIPLFWNGQTGIFIIFFFFLFIYFYLFKVFTKNQALGRIPIVEGKVFTWLVKGPFIFPWNVIQNTPPSSLDHPGGKACFCTLSRARTARILSILLHSWFLHAKTRKHITTTSWSKANSVWKGLKKAFQQHMGSWIEASEDFNIGWTGHWVESLMRNEGGKGVYLISSYCVHKAYFRLHS